MHEMGIALEIIDIAAASIPADLAGVQVKTVNLKVGKLAAIVPESLRFCFAVATKNGPLDGAELVIEEIPVRARCEHCRHEWHVEGPAFRCPQCAAGRITLLSGRELNIESIEIID